jgi:hypothetical protein
VCAVPRSIRTDSPAPSVRSRWPDEHDDRAGHDLELLLVVGVHVRGGMGRARRHGVLPLDELAARLVARAQQADDRAVGQAEDVVHAA